MVIVAGAARSVGEIGDEYGTAPSDTRANCAVYGSFDELLASLRRLGKLGALMLQ